MSEATPNAGRTKRRRRHRSTTAPEEAPLGLEDTPVRSQVAAVFLALIPIAVCFFGAGRQTWSLGLAALLVGGALTAAPPKVRLSAAGTAAFLGLLILPLAAFLPAHWFGPMPEWRRYLTEEWSLPLGALVSPQPAATLEAWLVLACGILWLWNSIGQGFTDTQRRLALRTLMLGGGALAALSMLEYWRHIDIPWWPRDLNRWGAGYGPFANRNHISSVSALTAVFAAAVAHDALRRGSKWWLPALLAFLASLASILINTSRGGLLLFFLGMTLWLWTSAMQRGFFRKAAVWIALIMATGSILLVSGGNLSERLKAGVAWQHLGSDFRVRLFQDAMRISGDAPWAGMGLGNFSSVFPLVGTMHQSMVRFLHPESDLLWLLLETGLTVLLPCLGLLLWLAWLTGSLRSRASGAQRTGRRLRRAAAIGGLLALLHALVDVPLHGVGYALLAAFVLGLAVRSQSLLPPAGSLYRWLFRGLGVAILVLGAGWLGIATQRLEWPLPSTARELQIRAIRESQHGRPAAGMPLVERALKILPMEYGLYHLRAQLRLQLRQPSVRALSDFGIARALEPNVANFCYWEGSYWLAYDPVLAAVPWREWIRRNRGNAEQLWGGYHRMIEESTPYPDLLPVLRQMAVSPELKLIFLIAAPAGPEWNQCLEQLLAERPNLDGFDDQKLRSLFDMWYHRGDRRRLIATLEQKPSWQAHGWRILASVYTHEGNFEAAYRMAEKHQPPITRPQLAPGTSIDALRRAFVLSPADPRPGIELFYALRAKGETEEALYTLQVVSKLPSSPPILKREWAALEAKRGNYRKAWELLEAFMNAINR